MRHLIFILFVVVGISSCRVNFGNIDIPPEAKSFSVADFENNAPQSPPNLGQIFREALGVLIRTQINIPQYPSGGDLHFEGSLTGYAVTSMGIQTSDTPGQNRLTITVKVDYINRLDDTKNFSKSFSRFENFDVDEDFTSIEDELITSIFEQITQDVFNKAFGDW